MQKLILLTVLLFSTIIVSAQSDFVVVKKRNNRTVKTFMPGANITLTTYQNFVLSGSIEEIRNDSIFVKMYNIVFVPTQFGTTAIDTLGSNIIGVNYREIQRIDLGKRDAFGFVKKGTVFMIGGLGYIALNLINSGYLGESVSDPENLTSLAIAAGVAIAGLTLNRIYNYHKRNGMLYRIKYINMNDKNEEKAKTGF